MKPASLGADDFRNRSGESNHIVTHLGFNFLNTLQVEVCPFADGASCIFRYEACLGKSFGSCDFHGQPGAEPIFFAPDAFHVGTCITGNHDDLLTNSRFSAQGIVNHRSGGSPSQASVPQSSVPQSSVLSSHSLGFMADD